ncbi:MAG TPA: glycoside hydrolase domain-containing protein [Phycisphaerae bacterium]|nr:glycoside hydrolase domain-containing protein [Phycisphaerae bacterium]
MTHRDALIAAALAVLLSAARPCAAQPAVANTVPQPVVVLDTSGFWRMHHTLAPPVVRLDGGLKSALTGLKWLDWETPAPPANWTHADFDDGRWARFPLRRSAATPYLARLCLRGRFRVTDPAKVRGLKLDLDYHGGAAVYLNGKMIAQGDMPAGQTNLAAGYPPEAFVTADGKVLGERTRRDDETKRRLGLRLRKLVAVPIPARQLRAGVNVLAVEIVRAPYHKIVATLKPQGADRPRHPYDLSWGTCQIDRLQLAADSADGLVPNCARSDVLEVWNSDPLAGDFDMDFGDNCEALRPIHLVGARNGSYSGKVVVGSTKPIAGLKATASDLKADGGATIPASAVHIRYGVPWGAEYVNMSDASSGSYPASADLLGALAEAAPQEIPVRKKHVDRRYALSTPHQPPTVFGAVASVWATVRIPADAKVGTYKGRITIEADGRKLTEAPIELKVIDWTLPEPQDYRTWIEFIQSPDTLAVEHKLEPWSGRHWEMIARSFRYLSETPSRVVYVPLIAETNLGNEHSMVRWIRKGEGRFDFDLSVMDKYLDIAAKNMGTPKFVCFVVWDIYLVEKEIGNPRDIRKALEARKPLKGKGPLVTVLDPATGKLQNEHLPRFTDAGSMEIWKPLFAQIRSRMNARGLESAAALGFISDVRPTKDETQLLYDASGGMPWISHSHHGVGPVGGIAKVAYSTHVWHCEYPGETSLFGWKQPRLHAQFQRGNQNASAAARWRHCAEVNIAGGQRGIGRLGADFWYTMKNKDGRRMGTVAARYPQSAWRNLDMHSHFLAPGPDGPIVTNRFEAVREGLQECEARIYLEKALTDKALRARLSDELAGRIKQVLDERLLYMWKHFSHLRLTGRHYQWAYFTPWRGVGEAGHSWFFSTGWQQRSEKLYLLAGEVHRKLGQGESASGR